MKLSRKMRSNFESAEYPDEVKNVRLEVHGPNSLMVSFDEPTKRSAHIIIKYMS